MPKEGSLSLMQMVKISSAFGCEAVSNQNTQQTLALLEKEVIHVWLL